MNNFAQKLRKLRKKAGYTQAELAFLIGVHETTIRRWEKSERVPRFEDLKQLAQVLNVPEETLFRDNKPKSITVNFYWEVDDDDMNLIDLRPDTFSFGYCNGQVLLAGSFAFDMSVDAIMDKIRAEIVAAKAGKEARDKALKKQSKNLNLQ